MVDPLQHARELAAALLAELARLRRETPDDQALLGAEQAVQAAVARLTTTAIVDPPYPGAASDT
jgi:hypothetical protein